MEYCKFHKGKRKTLLGECVEGYENNSFLNVFNKECDKLFSQIDCELDKQYGTVLSDMAAFTNLCWKKTSNMRAIPTMVVRCEAADGYDFIRSLIKLLNVKPICISPSKTISLHDVYEGLNKMGDKKFVILRQFECFTAPKYLDGLISIFTDPVWEKKIVFLITVAIDFNIIFVRFSQESFWKLDIQFYCLPAPKYILQTVSKAVAVNPTNHVGIRIEHTQAVLRKLANFQIVIDGFLHKELRNRFLRDSLSISEVKRILKVTLLHKMLECKDFGQDVAISAENATLLTMYETFLYLLHELTTDFPNQAEDVYELHNWIQLNRNFFSEKEGPYSIWITWSVDEMLHCLQKLWTPVKKIARCYSKEIEVLLADLRDADNQKNDLLKQLSKHHHEEAAAVGSSKRVSFHEMQLRLRNKIAHKKRLDLVHQNHQRFVKLLTQIMSKALRCFNDIPILEKKLLTGRRDILDMVFPSFSSNLEQALLLPKCEKQDYSKVQMDICFAYRSLLDLSLEYVNIPVPVWLAKFKKYIAKMKGISPVLRLFRCIGELEFMGILKPASDGNRNKVKILYLPQSVAY
ncbi:unnamed protein product [Thelazia callipaeda]|uniref:Vacuolar protein sorting-associated protein 33B n=1 Tax=Thelazia callipaeda TaxID=103827 RepID=A0A0N5D321_THECL|nr:unnamed protein product [Thelazia callipaeda]